MDLKQLMEKDGFEFKRIGTSKSSEAIYASPCPWCKGEDRFRIFIGDKGPGNFICQKCQIEKRLRYKGFVLDYLIEIKNMEISEAKSILGLSQYKGKRRRILLSDNPGEKNQNLTSGISIPNSAWRNYMQDFVRQSISYLTEGKKHPVHGWLKDRGISKNTCQKFKLGFNLNGFMVTRTELGFGISSDGKKEIYFPAGLVIPHFRNGHILSVKIRSFKKNATNRYSNIQGSKLTPMVIGNNSNRFIIVESELDGFLLNQIATDDFITVVVLGSASIRPDRQLFKCLQQAQTVLVALDDDPAGNANFNTWWADRLPHCVRWLPIKGKDPSESYQNGVNIDIWIKAGAIYSINNRGRKKECMAVKEKNLEVSRTVHFDIEHRIVSNADDVQTFLDKAAGLNPLAVDLITSEGEENGQEIKWIIIYGRELPITCLQICTQEGLRNKLSDLLGGSGCKYLLSGKRVVKALQHVGVDIGGQIFDLELAGRLLGYLKSGGCTPEMDMVFKVARHFIGEDEIDRYRKLFRAFKNDDLKRSIIAIDILKKIAGPVIEKLKIKGLLKTAKLEFDCMSAVARMESNGMLVDGNRIEKLALEFNEQIEILRTKLQDTLGDINFQSFDQLLKGLKDKGYPISDTKKETLKQLAESNAVFKDLLDYRQVSSLRKFVSKILKNRDPVTGRVHSKWIQISSESGRMSSRNHNIQNTPKDRRLRRCFVPAPGHRFIVADYSQIELRILAEVSGDQAMIQAFQNKEDLHRYTASQVMGKTLDNVGKKDRQAAKALNFGLIYGMGVDGFRKYAREKYGVTLNRMDAKRLIGGFFRAYPGVKAWQDRIRATATSELVTLGGRRVGLYKELSMKKRLNFPIQGTSADILKKALVLLDERLRDFGGAKIVCTIHDEIVVEVPDRMVEEVVDIVRGAMVEAGEGLLKRVPVVVDLEVRESWGG